MCLGGCRRGRQSPLISTIKSYLFTGSFKYWERVVCLDADTIVMGPLGPLANPRCYTAPPFEDGHPVSKEFRDGGAFLKNGLSSTRRQFDLSRRTLDPGVFSFPTTIIQPQTFDELKELFQKSLEYAYHPQRAVFDLMFSVGSKELSFAYGSSIWFHVFPYFPRGFKPTQFFGAVLHFSEHDGKPWMAMSPRAGTWRRNLERASQLGKVDFRAPSPVARLGFAAHVVIFRAHIAWLKAYFRLRAGMSRLLPGLVPLKNALSRRIRGVHPEKQLLQTIQKYSKGQVSDGPFRGMRFTSEGIGSAPVPKLLGTYEKELGPMVEQLCAMPFDRIINVGAGDGFYAVGMAMKTRRPVIAYEMDEMGRKTIEEVAKANGVSENISIRGACDTAALNQALGDSPSALVVMDVEGMEDSLLDPEKVPSLLSAHILVEIHDMVDRTLGSRIIDRFRQTHSLKEIWSSDRTFADFPIPLPPKTAKKMEPHVLKSMYEYRPEKMRWFYLEPRVPMARVS